MKAGWYILEYHNVEWEENPFMRIIRGTFPPDIFYDHMQKLGQIGEIVDVQTGLELTLRGNIKKPLFTIWFDDGYVSMRKIVLPIMESLNLTAAVSLCSNFWRRQEIFWRFQLSYLYYSGQIEPLLFEIKKMGWCEGISIKEFTISAFSKKLRHMINEQFQYVSNDRICRQIQAKFDTPQGLQELKVAGWELTNHTRSHYPIGEPQFISDFAEEFLACDQAFQEDFKFRPQFWVLPFDRPRYRAPDLLNRFYENANENQYLVLVGNGINEQRNVEARVLFRIHLPVCGADTLLSIIKRWARPGSKMIKFLI